LIIVVISHCAIFVPLFALSTYSSAQNYKRSHREWEFGIPIFPIEKILQILLFYVTYVHLVKLFSIRCAVVQPTGQADRHAVCLKLMLCCCVQFVCGYKLSPFDYHFARCANFHTKYGDLIRKFASDGYENSSVGRFRKELE